MYVYIYFKFKIIIKLKSHKDLQDPGWLEPQVKKRISFYIHIYFGEAVSSRKIRYRHSFGL